MCYLQPVFISQVAFCRSSEQVSSPPLRNWYTPVGNQPWSLLSGQWRRLQLVLQGARVKELARGACGCRPRGGEQPRDWTVVNHGRMKGILRMPGAATFVIHYSGLDTGGIVLFVDYTSDHQFHVALQIY